MRGRVGYRRLGVLGVPLLLVVTAAGSSATLSGPTLVVDVSESGLSPGAADTVTTTAAQSVTYECVPIGGKHRSGSRKRTFAARVQRTDRFTADQDGKLAGSQMLDPASAVSLGFGCTSGRIVTLVSVSYTGVRVDDTTSGASTSIPGTFTYTNPAAPGAG
jgi:hypothetical protein